MVAGLDFFFFSFLGGLDGGSSAGGEDWVCQDGVERFWKMTSGPLLVLLALFFSGSFWFLHRFRFRLMMRLRKGSAREKFM